MASIVPQASRDFWRCGTSGDTNRMMEVYEGLIKPITEIRSIGPGCNIGGIKAALEILGRAGGPTRPPEPAVDASDRAVIAEILRRHYRGATTSDVTKRDTPMASITWDSQPHVVICRTTAPTTRGVATIATSKSHMSLRFLNQRQGVPSMRES